MDRVYPWSALEADFNEGLILGNGASIAFDGRFAYGSLKDEAAAGGLIAADVGLVFEHLGTSDFELVMRMLWHASQINQALVIPDARTTAAYESVRDALIAVIRAVHVPYAEVQDRLAAAAAFMGRFSTVASLSYDLLVYWAVLVANETAPNRIKDCFLSGDFQRDWSWMRRPFQGNTKTTLVFYPHGSLALASDIAGKETKIQADDGADLLLTIFDRWRNGDAMPLFVSEGTSPQKQSAIDRSRYLSAVHREVLPTLGGSVVVLGWGLGDNDDHLLDAVCSSGLRRIAWAVNPEGEGLEIQQSVIRKKLADRLGRGNAELTFFDWKSPGCWLNP